MKLETFPSAGKINGASQLRQQAFKVLSFIQVSASFNKNNKSPHAETARDFFLECARICDEFIEKKEKKKG